MDGPKLEFEILGDRNNFIDIQKLLPEITCKISWNNGGNLRTGTDDRRKLQTCHTLATTHYILYFQIALYLLTVSNYPTPTETMRRNPSLKRNFLQENLQKTHG